MKDEVAELITATQNLHIDTERNLKREQYKQHTPEWYAVRETLLTASMLAEVLQFPKSESARHVYKSYLDQFKSFGKVPSHGYCGFKGFRETWLRRHHVPWSGGGQACWWGTRFEPVANSLYERIYKTKLHELGLIPHESHPWIAVSPDGITSEGRLVEIKCAVFRKITDDGYCPFYYWIQCQLQMEVCDTQLPLHFWQCQFQLYEDRDAYLEDVIPEENQEQWKGAFIQLNNTKCIYPDFQAVPFNSDEIVLWAENQLTEISGCWDNMDDNERKTKDQLDAPKIVYWKTQKVKCTTIERCRHWFESILEEAMTRFHEMQDKSLFTFTESELATLKLADERSCQPLFKPSILSKKSRAGPARNNYRLPSGIGLSRNFGRKVEDTETNLISRSSAEITQTPKKNTTGLPVGFRPFIVHK